MDDVRPSVRTARQWEVATLAHAYTMHQLSRCDPSSGSLDRTNVVGLASHETRVCVRVAPPWSGQVQRCPTDGGVRVDLRTQSIRGCRLRIGCSNRRASPDHGDQRSTKYFQPSATLTVLVVATLDQPQHDPCVSCVSPWWIAQTGTSL